MTGREHPRRFRPQLYVAGGQLPPAVEVGDDQLVVDELVDTLPADPILQSIRLDLLADELRDQLRHAPAQPAAVEVPGQLVADEWPTILAPATTRPPVPLYAAPRRPPEPEPPAASSSPAPASSSAPEVIAVPTVSNPHRTIDLRSGKLRRLDWASRHDERSRAFAVADQLRRPVPLQDRLWERGPVLDQGSEGACVGFAGAAAANVIEAAQVPATTRPASIDWLDDDDARRLYEAAQDLDDVPGSDYEGTSVLAGMKAGAAAGYWRRYLWAFGTRDIAQAVMQIGPVVIGIPWYAGMYETGPAGVVEVSGDRVGGHCLAVIGLRMQHAGKPGPWFVWQNSWGSDYGDAGLGVVHHKLLRQLLAGSGEAAIPLPLDEAGVTAL